MGGMASMLYSGAVEAAAGMTVSGAVSSVASSYEMHEEIDVTLFQLQQEVIKIQCAISVARARRIRDPKLFEWLALLINAEILGKFYQRTFKRRNSLLLMIESEGTSNLPISTFRRGYKRQRTIRSFIFGDDELKELNNVLQKLRSIDICAFIAMMNAHPERPVRTYIYMEPNRLLNRDKEIEYLLKFLLEPSRTDANNVDVLPMVGGVGVGKTSLALHCFYKPNVQNHFSMKMYVPRGGMRLFEGILWECSSMNNVRYDDQNTLAAMLKQKLSSERFLLVMDKVWTVCPVVWNLLLECLRCGKQGSKVILIMRPNHYTKYSNIVKAGTLEPLKLDWFSEEEYSLYFKEHAFGSADPDDFSELIQIGRDIEKKMKRSIWGAKILGEILRYNLNAPFWYMFLHEGLSDSDFRYTQIFSVCNIMCWLLNKCLDVPNAILTCSKKWDGEYRSYDFKSFGELMVLGATYWTPIIDEDGKDWLPFLVTKFLFEREYYVIVGDCEVTRNGTEIQLRVTRYSLFRSSNTTIYTNGIYNCV